MDTLAIRTLGIDELVTYTMREGARMPDGHPMPFKQVADGMNLPLKVAYDVADGRRPLRAREVPSLVRATGIYAVADAIERQLGRVALMLPATPCDGDDDPAVAKAAKACKEFGEFIQQVGAAGADRIYTDAEADRIRSQAEDVIAAAMELVAQVDAVKVSGLRRRR